jgi:hypothetical protein
MRNRRDSSVATPHATDWQPGAIRTVSHLCQGQTFRRDDGLSQALRPCSDASETSSARLHALSFRRLARVAVELLLKWHEKCQ